MRTRRYSELLSWLLIDPREADLARQQVAELQRQIPLLYALLMVNAGALAYTHLGIAPLNLTLALPALLLVVSSLRLLTWLRQRKLDVTPVAAVALLRRTVVVAGILSLAYVYWALLLDGYGGPLEQAHVALFIAITVIGCIFCLIHLPQAALVVTMLVTIPYLVHYIRLENPVFVAMALNIFLVTAVMIQVLFNGFRGFVALMRSQRELAEKQGETLQLSEENARLANTDSLTGLPNRRYFLAELEMLIATAKAADQCFAIGLLDLDRFKPVNDTHGHAFGDRLLAEVGQRLGNAGIGCMTLARLGGDEFGFLIRTSVADATDIGQRYCDLLAEPIDVDDIRITLGACCGIAVYPDAGLTANALFDRADYALYNAKSNRRGQAILFSPDHETLIRSGRAIETALRAADFDKEMAIHFQPIVDTLTGALVSVEALARWTSPTLGWVAPDLFIPVAERTGLIHDLTIALYRKVLVQSELLPAGVGLSFNLSALDIVSPETVLAVIAMTRLSGIDQACITLELTETAVMRNFEAASEALSMLRALGIKIALDDFGTGYSSLGYLHRLPLDKVKIDRSFVVDLENPAGRKIVTAILGLCQNLQLACIVEGVETEAQLNLLRELGCRQAQGYFFGRPMPIGELMKWIEARAQPLRLLQAI